MTKQIDELQGHVVYEKIIKIDTAECMRYLTANADPIKIICNLPLQEVKPLLWKIATAENTVGVFDEETWQGVNYSGMQLFIHKMIVIHSSQNQRVENHVQLTALVQKTNIGEARGISQAMMH